MGSKRLYLEQLKESLGITPEFILSRDMSAGDVVQIKLENNYFLVMNMYLIMEVLLIHQHHLSQIHQINLL
jgi:hypothetical protein